MTQTPRDLAAPTLTVAELGGAHAQAMLCGEAALLQPDGAPEVVALVVDLASVASANDLELARAASTVQSFESAVRVGVLHAADGDPGLTVTEPGGSESRGELRLLQRLLGDSAAALRAALDIIIVPAELEAAGTRFAAWRTVVGEDNVAAALDELLASIRTTPIAAVCFAQVMRAGAQASPREATNIESFAFSMLLRSHEFQVWLSGRQAAGLRPPELIAHPVEVLRDGTRLEITLNHPQRRNAYGRQLRDALADALRVAQLDDTITSVSLSGAGKAFCSGGDLAEFGHTPDVALAHFIRTRAGVGHQIMALGNTLSVEVHGACVGAGIEIAAFGAHLVARGSTVFKLPELSMGLIPGAGGTVSVARRIGRHRTAWLVLTGCAIDENQALSWGLVDEIVPGAEQESKIVRRAD